jgi:uncharacterized protein Veg
MKTSNKGKISVGQKLKVIKSRIRRGDYVKLASETGYDRTHVRRVLLGESNNPSCKIVNAAYKAVAKRKVS